MQIHILEGKRRKGRTEQLLKQFLEFGAGYAAFIVINEQEAKRIKHLIYLKNNKDFIDKTKDIYTWDQILNRTYIIGTNYKTLFIDNLDIMLTYFFQDKQVFATTLNNSITVNKLQ